jgi:hypothetical protein
LVTKPPPQPQWGYSPPGYRGGSRPTAAQIEHLAKFLRSSPSGLGEDSPVGLGKLLAELFLAVESFQYTDQIKRGKDSPGYSLPPDEISAVLADLKDVVGQARSKLLDLDYFTRAQLTWAYGLRPDRYRQDVDALCRLYDNLAVVEKHFTVGMIREEGDEPDLTRNLPKKGTPLTRVGRFAAWKLIDIYQHSPDRPFDGERKLRHARRPFLNSAKAGKDGGPGFVLAGLKILIPFISDTQARTALRYALKDRTAAPREPPPET